MKATVYQQCDPTPNGGLFRIGGTTYPDHDAHLVRIGSVDGTLNECRKHASTMCHAPVLEFDMPATWHMGLDNERI